MIHDLKTWPVYFKAIRDGLKPFELRKNDRNYQVGDVLMLKEYKPQEDKYTGNILRVEVTYVFEDNDGGRFGLREGYCIMGIKFADFEG